MSGMVDGIRPHVLMDTLVPTQSMRPINRVRRQTPRPLRRTRPLSMAAMPMDGLRRQLPASPIAVLPSWEPTVATAAVTQEPVQTPAVQLPRLPRRHLTLLAIPLAAIILIPASLNLSASWRKPTVAAAADAAPIADSAKAVTTIAPAVVPSTTIDATALQSKIDAVATSSGPLNLYVSDLKGTAVSGHNADVKLLSASLYKLFVAYSLYNRIDAGRLSLSSAVDGTTYDVNTCLNRMITISDNDCGIALGNTLNWGSGDTILKTAGFGDTDLATPQQTTARDVGHLLEQLYHGTLLSPTTNAHFLGLLKAQQINNRLPASLPAGTQVAHKTGDLYNYVHDAGIVYSPKGDYVVVAMSGPWNDIPSAAPSIASASRQIYDFINQ
jgi:beta-lactamase class A